MLFIVISPMKQVLFSFCITLICLTKPCTAQIQQEWGIGLGMLHEGITFKKKQNYLNTEPYQATNNFVLFASYEKYRKQFIFSSSVQFTALQFTPKVYESSIHFWNNGSEYVTTKSYSQQKVSYLYTGLRLDWSFLCISKENFSVYLGPFLQLDVLSFQKESGHRDSTISTHVHKKALDPNTQTFYEHSETSTQVSYEKFDGVGLRMFYPTVGIQCKTRYALKKGSIGAQFSFGFYTHRRYEFNRLSADEHLQNKRLFLQLAIHYVWPMNEQK